MEDYKKKYEEALERVRMINSGNGVASPPDWSICETIFPELKENEDKRWINWLIGHLKGYINQTDDKYAEVCKKAIAWLEKKSKQKPKIIFLKFRIGDKVTNGKDIYTIDSIDKDCYWVKEHDCMTIPFKYQHYWKLVEQTSTNKVESKFKVGDWVVWDNKISCHVDNIYQGKESLMYTITDTHNMTRSYSVKGFDNNTHLWTIQDAKDGDVLTNGDMVLIFKCFEEPSYRQHIIAYIGLDTSGNIQVTNESWILGLDCAKPATKEQRDILIKEMADDGYTFDFEKKELKKLEQKYADKVEPEFEIKKGNWYVCDTPRYRDFIVGEAYFCPKNGMLKPNENGMARYVAKHCFHLWTIQDAKDGDVLANKNGAIFINAGSLKGRLTMDCYCYLSVQNEFCIEEHKTGSWFYKDDIHPATKEQRELLFQKMKEAGYEWLSDKKELKKIEQNLAKNSSKTSENVIEEIDMSEYNKGFECGKQLVLKYPEDFNLCEKPASAWSEEDEKHYQGCLNLMRLSLDTKPYPYYNDYLWFKSLKERVQPQPKHEWSVEDENRFNNLIDLVEHSDEGKGTKEGFVKFINRLKSLRPQSHWRPSEEMLEALYRAVPENVKEISEDEMLLGKLYQGLKYGRVIDNK